MKILIDADGCPVVDISCELAAQSNTQCVIICDTSHSINKAGAKTVVVSQGDDSADFALVNMVSKGDIVITQDYGLAAMCIARGAVPVNQDGMLYNDGNIDALLHCRHNAQKIRRAGGRLKGPSKRTREQDEKFKDSLCNLIKKQQMTK
ncbi:MAG: YaiI/YqxD family protein [Oscillospiraceae bacterium]|jgi:uncharacterized protein YaiI (UPF0178 family)|nr:YaiI/YqxD family protein [Oscillospiraceae bacterium]